jgi:hypothetical protein
MSKARTSSGSVERKSGTKKLDDALLDARIDANKIDYPKHVLYVVGLVTSFLPAYLAHAVFDLPWTNPMNMPLFVVVLATTSYMLAQAYSVMIESEFWKRQRHYAEVKDEDSKQLRKLRLQVALGYTLFLINGLFFVICTLFHVYIFRHADPRASLILSPSFTSALLWLIAQKNEESRKRRMSAHK